VTKSQLITRDVDLLAEMAKVETIAVFVSVTTLDADLARAMEPRATQPEGRLRAIQTLAKAGIPVGVMAAPLIPGLNDHEVASIISAAASAGAKFARYTVLRLPHGLPDLFESWLDRCYPEKKDRILARTREVREGRLNSSGFGTRMSGIGPAADAIKSLYEIACRKAGLQTTGPELRADGFRNPDGMQQSMFD
jgi:DNA repair photolyase